MTQPSEIKRLRARFKGLWREKECDELRAEIEQIESVELLLRHQIELREELRNNGILR